MSKAEMAEYLREHRSSFAEYSDEEIRYVLSVWESKDAD